MRRLVIVMIAAFAAVASPIEHDYAEVNGVRLHYASPGAGN